MFRARSLTLALTACAALAALTGCSSAAESSAPGAPAEESQASSSGDFCGDYSAAGGTLATPSNFQVGLPAQQTISDLSARVAVLDAATPPDEIATQWQTLHDLYTETITIAEQVPADEVVVDPRVFEIVKEISDPGKQVRDYLDAEC